MNEDVNTVSPTLGFIIKTIDYEGYVLGAGKSCNVRLD
jgi:ADP-ribosylation factor-like protein 2